MSTSTVQIVGITGKVVDVVAVQQHRPRVKGDTPDEARFRIKSSIAYGGWTVGPVWHIAQQGHPMPQRLPHAWDLAGAMAVLESFEIIPKRCCDGSVFFAGLTIDGQLRTLAGPIVAAKAARDAGYGRIFVARSAGGEAAFIEGIEVVAVDQLANVVAIVLGEATAESAMPGDPPVDFGLPDLEQIHGQPKAKRALEIAAAGKFSLALMGPPGVSKTMLARAMVGILPDMTHEEVLETTCIHSVCGLTHGAPAYRRPFRAPHYTVSEHSLGTEAAIAHNGVLLLDDAHELNLSVGRQITSTHAMKESHSRQFGILPSDFQLVVSVPLCMCRWTGSGRPCICNDKMIEILQRVMKRAPIASVDMSVTVNRADLASGETRESSATVRARVTAARKRAAERNDEKMEGGQARIARTIADLEGSGLVTEVHILEAASFKRGSDD